MTYQGKQSDSTSAVLLMALETIGVKSIPHLDCLTTRPFSMRCPRQNPALWLSPFIEPIEGVLMALKLLDVQHRVEMVSTDWDNITFLDMLEQCLKIAPVILGPLNRAKIWDRMNSRYYKGDAYFLLVIACESHGRFIAHDPEGCPYFLISKEKLLSAIDCSDFKIGIIQLQRYSETRPYKEVFQQILLAGKENYMKASHHGEGGSNGLYFLAQEIVSKKLKSSEEGCLHFAIPALGLVSKQVIEFLSDVPHAISQTNLNWHELVSSISILLSENILHCAYALEFLRLRDQKKLSEQFLTLANNQRLIENLFVLMEFSVQ